MKITRRDLCIAAVTCCITAALAVAARSFEKMSSTIISWEEMTVRQTKTGAVRSVFRAPTATLDELECHITTLNPGETSHAPHQHPEEEIIIVKEGFVEQFANGVTKRVGPGAVIFLASGEMHSIRNVGEAPATYHVFSWHSAATPAKK